MSAITVKATKHPVAMENDSHRSIGADPVTVEESSYYLRRIQHGELVRVTGELIERKTPKKNAKEEV